MEKREGHFLIYVFVFLVAAGSLYYLKNYAELRRPLSSDKKVITEITYTICGHKVKQEVDTDYIEKVIPIKLQETYAPNEGWKVEFTREALVFKKTVNDLCEECARQTHLGVKGGFIAVIRGPVGVNGGVINVTKIRVSDLPKDLQEMAQKGCLDLQREEQLSQILDTYDENMD